MRPAMSAALAASLPAEMRTTEASGIPAAVATSERTWSDRLVASPITNARAGGILATSPLTLADRPDAADSSTGPGLARASTEPARALAGSVWFAITTDEAFLDAGPLKHGAAVIGVAGHPAPAYAGSSAPPTSAPSGPP